MVTALNHRFSGDCRLYYRTCKGTSVQILWHALCISVSPRPATVAGSALKDDNERIKTMSKKTKRVARVKKGAEAGKRRQTEKCAREATAKLEALIKTRYREPAVMPNLLPLHEKYEPLRPELLEFVIPFSGSRASSAYGMFRHPWFIGEVYSLDHCADIHHMMDQQQHTLVQLNKRQRLREVVMAHAGPYRLQALADYTRSMTDRVFWKTFADVWTDSENLWQDTRVIRRLLSNPRPCREEMMTTDERRALKRMPATLTIYRGFNGKGTWRGWSWTISKEKGEWFARRPKGPGADSPSDPTLVEATVKKADAIAYITARNESEIVVDPKRVKIVSTTVLKPRRKTPRLVRMTDWLKAQMETRTSASCPAPGDAFAKRARE
jgi:hypothetical protein